MKRLRWLLSGFLESISGRFQCWADQIAPETERLDLQDIIKHITPTETPFLKKIKQ